MIGSQEKRTDMLEFSGQGTEVPSKDANVDSTLASLRPHALS